MVDLITEGLIMIAGSMISTAGIGAVSFAGYKGIKLIRNGNTGKEQTDEDRCQHTWMIGKNGTGKSTFDEYMAVQDIMKGRRIVFIDVHGQSARRLIGLVDKEHMENVIYVAPKNLGRLTIGLNPLKLRTGTAIEKAIVCDALLGSFEKVFGGYWGVSTEDIIRMAILGVLDRHQESTLWDVYSMITNEMYRDVIVQEIRDPLVRQFWTTDFKKVGSGNLNAPLNKLRTFLSNPYVTNTICQTGDKTLDIGKVMKENNLIVDLGGITEIASKLLAGFLLAGLQIETLKRSKQDIVCALYFDEFQTYVNDSCEKFLSECRKYRVALTLSHQYVGQLPDGIQRAIRGNVGSCYAFRVGQDDSSFVGKVMEVEPQKLELLANHIVCQRRLVHGKAEKPVTIKTPAPLPYDKVIAKYVMENSLRKHGMPPFSLSQQIVMQNLEAKEIIRGNASGLEESI